MANKENIIDFLSETDERLNAVFNLVGINHLYKNGMRFDGDYTERIHKNKIFEDIEKYSNLKEFNQFSIHPKTDSQWANSINALKLAQGKEIYLGRKDLNDINNQINDFFQSSKIPGFLFINSGAFISDVWKESTITNFEKLLNKNKDAFFIASSNKVVEKGGNNPMINKLVSYCKDGRGKLFIFKKRPNLHFLSVSSKRYNGQYRVKGTFQGEHYEDKWVRQCYMIRNAGSFYLLLKHNINNLSSPGCSECDYYSPLNKQYDILETQNR